MPSTWNRCGTLSETPAMEMSPDAARREVLRLRLRVCVLQREIDRGRPLTATEQLNNLEDGLEMPRGALLDATVPFDGLMRALGRFGHHTSPSIDFEVECDYIIGMAADVKAGVRSADEVRARRDRALEFRVGGVRTCVAAKDKIRALEI